MKAYLNTRQFEILSELLRDDTPRTVEDIANSLNLKPRVIQYNLNAIDGWLRINNAKIIRRSGFGLQIDLSETRHDEIVKLLSGLEDIELVIDTKQRRRCILIKLILQGKPMSSSRLASDFCVSRTTILGDLLDVQPWLKLNQLEMIKIPHKGFFIRGNKSLKRFAVCALFCEEHFENKRSVEEIGKLIVSTPLFEYLMGEWFNSSDLQFSLETISKIEELLKSLYSQTAKTFLCYSILLLLTDIRRHQQITDKVVDEISTFDEISSIKFLKNSFEIYTREKICDSEMQLLVLHLHCQTKFNEPVHRIDSKKVIESSFASAKPFTNIDKEVVKEISLFINPYLQIDKQFFIDLSNYLDQCFVYQKYGFSIYNPYIERIKKIFPDTLSIVERIALNYIKYIQLNEYDIGTITMITVSALDRIQKIVQREVRVILISNTDQSLTSYTKERISNNFPWFKMVGVFRHSDNVSANLQNVDLILTTSGLDLDASFSTIIVDPFVTQLDIQHIQNWINEHAVKKNSNIVKQENIRLSDLLFENNIIFREKAENWEEAAFLVGKPLVENGDITNDYIEAIIQVNKTYGPYSVVAPGIVLLHAKATDGVNKLCLGLMILKQGINFGVQKFDPVNILFIIGLPDSHSHLQALQDLINIIRSKGFNESILKCSSPAEAKEIVLRYTKAIEDN
jgi:transcriptional antiterminator/mannitol/fructose-specific phosphotransferase system IIA component